FQPGHRAVRRLDANGVGGDRSDPAGDACQVSGQDRIGAVPRYVLEVIPGFFFGGAKLRQRNRQNKRDHIQRCSHAVSSAADPRNDQRSSISGADKQLPTGRPPPVSPARPTGKELPPPHRYPDPHDPPASDRSPTDLEKSS